MTRWKRAVVGFAALLALVVLNGLAIAFVTGFVVGLARTSTVWALAAVAAAVLVAPFNLVLFRRFCRYVEGPDPAQAAGGESA